MRLLPLRDPERSWRNIKAQWKKDAEGVGEEFATFGGLNVIDALTAKDDGSLGLYHLTDGERVHAVCQVRRLLMSKYTAPALRARFVQFSPLYDLGSPEAGDYAQTLVALFSGVVWLSRDALAASHIRFFLKSPGDSQYFTALKIDSPLSPFSRFTIDGALIECSLREQRNSAAAASP